MNMSNPDKHVHAKERAWLLAEKYAGRETPEFFADLERLAQGEPLAYVIGWVDFLGARIDLSLRPLIPRPETEWWTERLIAQVREIHRNDAPLRILDLFSGSGAVGIAFAHAFPNASIICTDISPRAIEEIRINAAQNQCADRVQTIASDVFSSVSGAFDVITANPPYIDPNHTETVERSVLDWEPREALFADDHGLAIIVRTLQDVSRYMNSGAVFGMEFGSGQEHAITELVCQRAFSIAQIENDQFGVPRWLYLRK